MNMENSEGTRRPADLLETSTNKVQPKSDLSLTKKSGLSHSRQSRGFIDLNLEDNSRSSTTIDRQSGKIQLDIRLPNENDNKNIMGVEMRRMNMKTHATGLCESSITKSKLNVGATQILPHLYLGSQKDVMDKAMMDKYGITYVLNVSTNCTQPSFIDNQHFHRISVRDNHQEKMMPHMKEAITFIEKVRKLNQRVLVHCLAGVSRSATVAIAYVIYYTKMNFEESYRFVKDKRQSISPNFNFLGQLMEFEKTLKSEGHMTTCAGEIVSDDCKCANKLPDENTIAHNKTNSQENNRTLNFYNDSETALPKFILPVTCSVAPISPSTLSPPKTSSIIRPVKIPHTPTSSFCKRRRGPALSKIVFTPTTECSTQLMTPALRNTNHFEQSTVNRLRIDVHVTAPSHVPDHSARLGSDGTEMDDQPAPCLSTEEPKPMTAPSTPVVEKRKPATLTLKPTSATRHRRSASSGVADIKLGSGLDLKRRLWDSTCKSTSCLSPAVNSEHAECRTKRSVSLNETTTNYFNLSTVSPRSPRKFLSCNSRSPKVMRKTFNLNLRPTYSYSKQTTETVTFDCSHSLKTPTDKPLKFTMDGNADSEALTLNSISPLTISSPTNDKDAESLFPISPATCPVTGSEPFLRTSITSSAQNGTTHKTISRVSFKTSLSFNAHGEKSSKAFTLSPGCDLKLKWRNNRNNRRRMSCDSGYASSQTSSSFTSPTTHNIAFSPCETTIDDTIDEPQEEPNQCNEKESNQSENDCVMAVDENRKFVSEPSSPLPVVGCRKAVEIMSCS